MSQIMNLPEEVLTNHIALILENINVIKFKLLFEGANKMFFTNCTCTRWN